MSDEKKKPNVWGIVFTAIKYIATLLAGAFGGQVVM